MRSKGRQGTYSLLLLFVGIFAFWWGIAVLAENDKGTYGAPSTAQASPSNAGTYIAEAVQGPIAVQTMHKGAVYTFSGSVPLASVCDELGTGISVSKSNPPHVTVILTLQKPTNLCAEGATTTQPFAVSLTVASGTQALLDGVTVNGVIVATRLVDASAN